MFVFSCSFHIFSSFCFWSSNNFTPFAGEFAGELGVLPDHGTFAGPPRWKNVSLGVLVASKTSFGLVDSLIFFVFLFWSDGIFLDICFFCWCNSIAKWHTPPIWISERQIDAFDRRRFGQVLLTQDDSSPRQCQWWWASHRSILEDGDVICETSLRLEIVATPWNRWPCHQLKCRIWDLGISENYGLP